MSGYRPDEFRNDSLVARVRARRAECGRVTDMPRSVASLGGGMVNERAAARNSNMPSFVRPQPVPSPDAALAAMEARLIARIEANGGGQGWLMLTNILCTVAVIAAVVAVGVLT